MSTVVATRLLYGRLARQEQRSPLTLVNLAIAVFFLAVYVGALGDASSIERLVGGDYLSFVLPVTILNAAIAGTAAGQALVQDLESGYLRRLLALPLPRTAIVLAPMLVGATQVLAQATLVAALGVALGVDSATGPAGWLLVLLLALLWGVAFAGYSVATGLLAGNAAAAQTASFAFFPLIFLAPTFLPRDQLQGWLERERLRRREQIVAGHVALTGRELAKQARWQEQIAEALMLRGFTADLADLLAAMGFALFRQTLRAWLDDDDPTTLRDRVRGALPRLRTVLDAESPGSAAGARRSGAVEPGSPSAR